MKYKMPGADASQFTQLKKALAIQGSAISPTAKSINRLTVFKPKLSAANSKSLTTFMPSVTKPKNK